MKNSIADEKNSFSGFFDFFFLKTIYGICFVLLKALFCLHTDSNSTKQNTVKVFYSKINDFQSITGTTSVSLSGFQSRIDCLSFK